MDQPPPLPAADSPLPTPDAPPEERPPALTHAPPADKLFPCLSCGARVQFDPQSRALKCPYCGSIQEVPADDVAAEVQERDFLEYLRRYESQGGVTLQGRSSQVRCTGCGAVVLLEDRVATTECPFCGTHLENQPEAAAAMVPPDSLLPFAIDLRAARAAFERWLHSLWFAPNPLKKLALLGELVGVYVPHWTYDAMTYTRYRGMRGDNYTVQVPYTSWENGRAVTRYRTEIRTRWRYVSGEVQHFFDDLLVCASHSVPRHLLRKLEPWPLEELTPFRSEFLAGWKTERYAVGLRDGFEAAKEIMEPVIDRLIRQDIGGDHQRILHKKTRYFGVTFKHCLLPIWVAHYRYNNKLYQILINGRTGRVGGERPWSVWKILAWTTGIIAAAVAIYKIVQYLQAP